METVPSDGVLPLSFGLLFSGPPRRNSLASRENIGSEAAEEPREMYCQVEMLANSLLSNQCYHVILVVSNNSSPRLYSISVSLQLDAENISSVGVVKLWQLF